jgi:hypothetical protein
MFLSFAYCIGTCVQYTSHGVVLYTHIVSYNEIISLLYLFLPLQQYSSFIYEILHMAKLGDCNILQLKHLVGRRQSRVHNSVSVRNLSIA